MVRELRESDIKGFVPIPVQQKDFEDTVKAFDAIDQYPDHQACACNSNGEPVLLFGFLEMWPRVYEAWTIFGEKWSPMLYPEAREWLSTYCKHLDFDRIQHTISEDRPWMHRVIQYLGFQCETDVPLRKYLDGKDAYMYAIIKE